MYTCTTVLMKSMKSLPCNMALRLYCFWKSGLDQKSGHGGAKPKKSRIFLLSAKVLLMASKGDLFTFRLPTHSATNVYCTTMLGKSTKSLQPVPCNQVSILLLEKWRGSQISTWWRQAKEIDNISACGKGFANGLRGPLVHSPASQPFRD